MKKISSSPKFVYILLGAISCTAIASTITYSPSRIFAQELARNQEAKSSLKNSASFIWPTQGRITQDYGGHHYGIDINNASGTLIFAAAAGEVIFAGWDDWGLGNAVEIRHGDGTVTIYGHNQRLLVRKGQQVEQGKPIAHMGSTGSSFAPHLHFEVKTAGRNWLNPRRVLPPLVGGQIPRNQPVATAPTRPNPVVRSAAAPVAKKSTLYRVEVPGTSNWLLGRVRTVAPGAYLRRSDRVIQAGAFSQQSSANRLVNSLRENRISARIVPLN